MDVFTVYVGLSSGRVDPLAADPPPWARGTPTGPLASRAAAERSRQPEGRCCRCPARQRKSLTPNFDQRARSAVARLPITERVGDPFHGGRRTDTIVLTAMPYRTRLIAAS
jgi:hypothetical protein